MLRCLFVIISSLILVGSVNAQEEIDSTVSKTRVLTPRLYLDYGKVLMLWYPESKKYEGGAELMVFERIQLIGEGGYSIYRPDEHIKNMDYSVSGNFFRLGIGYLGNIDPKNKIGLGLRYAMAMIEQEGTATINSTSGFNEPRIQEFENARLKTNWMEIVINSEKKVMLKKNDPASWLNNRLSLGIMFRYKILMEHPTLSPVDLYAIPGYGKTVNKQVFAANLFLKVNF
ncbi:MAG: hypothetical protein JXQ90_04135 [Cyclobacteriaceae bacterium]